MMITKTQWYNIKKSICIIEKNKIWWWIRNISRWYRSGKNGKSEFPDNQWKYLPEFL